MKAVALIVVALAVAHAVPVAQVQAPTEAKPAFDDKALNQVFNFVSSLVPSKTAEDEKNLKDIISTGSQILAQLGGKLHDWSKQDDTEALLKKATQAFTAGNAKANPTAMAMQVAAAISGSDDSSDQQKAALKDLVNGFSKTMSESVEATQAMQKQLAQLGSVFEKQSKKDEALGATNLLQGDAINADAFSELTGRFLDALDQRLGEN